MKRHDTEPRTSKNTGRMMLRSLTAIYILLLGLIVLGADLGILSPFSMWLHHIPFGDKTCHFVFVGLLSFFVSASLSCNLNWKRKRSTVLTTILVLAVLTSLEELSQTMLIYRQFSPLDMFANIAGACIFGSFALLISHRPVVNSASQPSNA